MKYYTQLQNQTKRLDLPAGSYFRRVRATSGEWSNWEAFTLTPAAQPGLISKWNFSGNASDALPTANHFKQLSGESWVSGQTSQGLGLTATSSARIDTPVRLPLISSPRSQGAMIRLDPSSSSSKAELTSYGAPGLVYRSQTIRFFTHSSAGSQSINANRPKFAERRHLKQERSINVLSLKKTHPRDRHTKAKNLWQL